MDRTIIGLALFIAMTFAGAAGAADNLPASPEAGAAQSASPLPVCPRTWKRLSGNNPEYPRAAVRAGVAEGIVVARVTVDEDGSVSDVTIVRSEPSRVFDKVVIETIKGWKYQPGGPKCVISEIESKFSLRLPGT